MQQEPATPYELIGGEAKVRELVDRFYDYMDTEAEAQTVRQLHAKSLKSSREKLFLFLSGWLGGPDLYIQKYGHPMLRRRHLPFAIGRREPAMSARNSDGLSTISTRLRRASNCSDVFLRNRGQ